MRAAKFVGLTVLLSAAVYGADKVTPMNVKIGLWDVTYSSSAKGDLPLDSDELKKLTPEQRASLEQMWKAQQSKGAQTETRKRCLTEKSLKEDPFIEKSPNCTRTVVTSSSSEIYVREQCSLNGKQENTSYDIRALTPESVKGTIRMEDTGNNKTMNLSGDFTAHWIAPICGNVE